MPFRIANSIGRVFRRGVPPAAPYDIHCHLDSVGRPYVCDYARCESPGLTADEAVMVTR
jgi:hypothetical protein